jgi:hypothetical protein
MKRPKIKNQTNQPVLVPIPGMNDDWMCHVSLLVGAMLLMQSTLGKKNNKVLASDSTCQQALKTETTLRRHPDVFET